MGIDYSGKNLPPECERLCTFEWKSFDTTSQPTSGSTAVNLRNTNHTGVWTNSQSQSPSANKTPTISTINGVSACQVYDGVNPSKWLRFPWLNTSFNNGTSVQSFMWWIYNSGSQAGNYHWGGLDGSPAWGSSLTNGTASICGIRNNQWELIGHGFDHRMGDSDDGTGRSRTNEWQCVIMTQDNDSAAIYVDGEKVGESVYNGGKNTASTNFFIGRSWSKRDLSGMPGYIAWSAYWKKRLCQSDVAHIFHNSAKFFQR